MQKLISSMPDLKKDTNITTKHFALSDEITKYVNKHNLLQLSKLEQEIASKDSRKEQYNQIIEIFGKKDIAIFDKF